ncbi:hypothetical protein [Demequina sp. NBRC 110053]|uniref:hypothetical protein n=1 Tax=Demequina sp. NBRC 110053 TaxID=1570342 RepID=UPI001185C166|nr:hypothetical protein [Demequina sp. NBRC 110053]
MRVSPVVSVALACAASALTACSFSSAEARPGGSDGAPVDGTPPPSAVEWPDEVVAAWTFEAGEEANMMPAPSGPRALVVVGGDGIVAWHSDVDAAVAEALALEGGVRVEPVALAAEARTALVAVDVSDTSSARQWAVWDLDTGDAAPVTCARGEPDVIGLLSPTANGFLVHADCGDEPTVATLDARSGVLAPGEAAPHEDSLMWVADQERFVEVTGAPGPCIASGRLSGIEIAVTCEVEHAHFEIGAVALATPDAASGEYAPDAEFGEYPFFFGSTAFVALDRHWVNTNTVEGTPVLATARTEQEYRLTALAAAERRILAARDLDPWAPSGADSPALGWYAPDSGEFEALTPPDGVRGIASTAEGVPVG